MRSLFNAVVVLGGAITIASAQSPAGKAGIPYADARPIFEALQPQLWPAELRTKTAPQACL